MLHVKKQLCLGCGICANNCPQQAINVILGYAEIDRKRCNQCGICLDLCPQGAIREVVAISNQELQNTIALLKQKTEEIIQRVEKQKQSNHDLINISP
jgi:ferredoxin